MRSLDVSLLGPVEVRRDGQLLSLPGTAQLLVARLSLTPDRAATTAELVDVLWPQHPPRNAIRNLRSYLSRLRKAVGADRVRWGPGGYRLDVRSEERLGTQATSLEETDPGRAVELLTEALALWRGAPLSGLPDRLSLAPELARLTELRLQLAERRFTLLTDLGRVAALLPDLERATRAEPLREGLHLLLVRALHQAGRTAEALAAARTFRRPLAEETGLDPSPALERLEQRLRTADPSLVPDQAPASTARRFAPANRFVGRATEIAHLRTALRDRRSVTVVGPGGVGKTRLVLELLDRLDRAVPVVLVELAAEPPTTDVATVVAARLGVQSAPAGAATALAERLGGEPTLLVLDNCEHVLTQAADLVRELLLRCPRLRVLATSRRRLQVPGEQVVRIAPLPHPDRVALFTDRAALLRGGFDGTRREVTQICGLLDGLTLAIELAAGREAVFGLRELRNRLGRGLGVLEPAPPADRTTAMGATVEWSYRLLDPASQDLLDRLSVTRGGFGADALDHLAPRGTTGADALLTELVEASIVLADLTSEPPRYGLLEPVRRVAAGHLDEARTSAAQAAHTRWMRAHVAQVRRLQDVRSPSATPLLRRELGNLGAALARPVDAGWWADAAELAVPLVVALSDEAHLGLVASLVRCAAAGTQGGPTVRLQLLADAGFRHPVLAADTGSNLVLAAVR